MTTETLKLKLAGDGGLMRLEIVCAPEVLDQLRLAILGAVAPFKVSDSHPEPCDGCGG